MRDISDWFPKLFSWPILFCIILGIFYVIYRFHKLGIIVLLWALIPLLLQGAFLKTFTARYLLSSVAPLLILGGYGIYNLLPKLGRFKKIAYTLLLIAILPLSLKFDYLLLTQPDKAPLPIEERRGYFEIWTAGYGFSEIAKYLLEKSNQQSVIVGTEGFFGTLPEGLYIYLDKSDISVVGSTSTISAQVRNAAADHATFFVGNKSSLEGAVDGVNLIKEYPKAKSTTGEQDATLFYEVLPK